MISIGIIGLGWVGSSVAISVLQRGICNELLLNDVRPNLAEGEAMDLNHGSSFIPSTHVKESSIEDMKHCNAIVVTAGRGGKPGESRLELLNDNIQIAREISQKLLGFTGLLVVVANPVDILTYYYQKFTGLPKSKVIGTGTMLDTARLREVIGRKISINPNSIHAQVIGEHGDSEVVLWSTATVGSLLLRQWPGWKPEYEEEIAREVKEAAQQIIKRKGATNHAIGLVTATLLKWLLRGDRRIINLSTVHEDALGVKDTAISLPTLVSASGVERVLDVHLDSHEKQRFLHSAQLITDIIRSADKF